jgi:hypothetical protein
MNSPPHQFTTFSALRVARHEKARGWGPPRQDCHNVNSLKLHFCTWENLP